MTRLAFVVHGRVQGIGYRWFARESADRLGLGGWVRNRSDGTVEGEAEGSPESVARFVETLRAGPPGARVSRVETRAVAATGQAEDFEIRH